MQSLKTLILGDHAGCDVHKVTFEGKPIHFLIVILDLPQLETITFGSDSFNGDSNENRKGSKDWPYNYKNTLIMKCM